jgi:site-specific DNA recombinase
MKRLQMQVMARIIDANTHPEGERLCNICEDSSPNQRMNHSIEEQVNRCWSFCKERGWRVTYVFIDESFGGGTIDRPKFKLMLEKAKEGCISVIVFWKLDRFCRSLVDLVNVERSLREWGVGLCSTTEYLDTTTSIGRFNFRSIASVAELEREMIGERARMGLHALARGNKWPNPHPPLGYEKGSDGKLVPLQKEVEIVRRIFARYIECKNMPQLAFELNSEGIATKKGKRWNARAIRDVIMNDIYIGSYSVAGVCNTIEDYKIIDDDLFRKANEMRGRYSEVGCERLSMGEERRLAKINEVFDVFFKLIDSQDGGKHD